MKQLICFVVLLIFSSNLKATSCFPNGIAFNNGNELLTALETCDTIGGDLILQGNFVNPFSTAVPVNTVLGDVRVLKSTQFTLNNAFENLTYIGGDLQISFSSAPFILNTFSKVEEIGGDLIIQGNPGFILFDFLNSLQSIGGKIIFEGNENLTAINGLQALTQVDGVIIMDDNPQLQCIFGLRNIDPAGIDNLTITDCTQLSICQLNNFCDYLNNNGAHTISNNAIGCNLTSEITAGCLPINCPTDELIFSTTIDDLNYKIIYKNCTVIDHDIFYAFTEPILVTFKPNGFTNQIEEMNGNIEMANDQSFLYDLGFNNLLNLNGNLSITSTAAISSLIGFSSLETISEDFVLENIESFLPFQSFAFGFNNLHTVEGNFEYRNNSSTESLPPFESLTTINGDLVLDSNGFQGLDLILNLTNVGGEIIISNNTFLNNITALINVDSESFTNLVIQNNPFVGFCNLPNFCEYLNQSNLATIEGNSAACGSVEVVETACAQPQDCQIGLTTITDQPDLNSFLAQYGNCNKINGNLTISGVDNLIPFQNIDTILGTVQINVADLENLNDFQNLKYIGGSLILFGDAGLNDLQGLDALTFIGNNLIILNTGLVDLTDDLGALERIGGEVSIEQNAFLTHTPIAENLINPLGDFQCLDNPSLITLQGFNNVNTLDGIINIQLNDSLISITAFQNLDNITGNFQIKTLSNLEEITGFGNLTTIESFATLFELDSLSTLPFTSLENIDGKFLISKTGVQDLSGLQNLNTISGDFEITNNQSLTDISDLSNLQTITGFLAIFNNNLLTSLDGLQNLDPTSFQNLFLFGSDLLSDCAVQSICDYLNVPSNPSSINSNATGCLTEEEILANCDFTAIRNNTNTFFKIYPNPATDQLGIKTPLDHFNLSIQNTILQEVLSLNNVSGEMIDISKLSSGIYFVIIEKENFQYVEKLVIK